MAIQNRRGSYADYNPSKLLPGEWAVVQENDPSSSDGTAVYMAFGSGNVKRMATYDEVEHFNNEAKDYADDAKDSKLAAQSALSQIQTLAGQVSSNASAVSQAAGTVETLVNGATTAINDAKEQAVADATSAITSQRTAAVADIASSKATAISDVNDYRDSALERLEVKKNEILAITTSAEGTATEALTKATQVENHLAESDARLTKLETDIKNVSIDPDDLGLYQDSNTFYVYPTYKGMVSENGIPLASSGGGGGGGGGEVIDALLTATNTTGWLSKTIAQGSSCNLSFTWSSLENDVPTGDGALRVTVNEIVRSTTQIQQGDVSVDVSQYLTTGTNKVKIRISDTYDQGKTFTFNITCMVLTISSSFDETVPYSGAISFPFTPIGAMQKVVKFYLDDVLMDSMTTSVSGRQLSVTIPSQSHGAHTFRVYFEATINDETVRSNELYYEFMFVDSSSNEVIITSPYNTSSVSQFSTVAFTYQVYTPSSLTSDVVIKANGTTISTQTVDRSVQSYSYRADNVGALALTITSGGVTKTLNITVTESDVDVEAATEGLGLFLTSQGRSNNEEHPEVWTYGTGANAIAATLTGFNWTSDGWQQDADGVVCLRVSGGARVTIPYNMFATDIRQTGFTVEVEFSTRNIADYTATVFSCYNGNRGFYITPQNVTLKSDQTELSMQYKEGEHIRIAYTVDKRSGDRLVKAFIGGTVQRAALYPSDDDFTQATPVGISIGSNDCTIDIYCIRVYLNDLTMEQVVDNWIADTQDGALMLERYGRNQVYNEYGDIVMAKLPSDLPYFILEAEELPQYKGDKKTITGSYTDPLHPSNSFTFTGMQINVQGTSSAPYARKNYDMQFKKGFEMTASGNHADMFKLKSESIPTNRFVTKADVASSEAANNTQGVQIYNDICPYKTPEMLANNKVRWGIDGFPIVIFWHNTTTGDTMFMGKQQLLM